MYDLSINYEHNCKSVNVILKNARAKIELRNSPKHQTKITFGPFKSFFTFEEAEPSHS